MVDAVGLTAAQQLLELGPGQGVLTERFYGHPKRFVAVEIDRDLAPRLAQTYPQLEVVTADVLKTDLAALLASGTWRVVGNLPYNVSTPLLLRLLNYRERIIDMHFMLQKEVVARMAASPGSKAYGRLGIMLGCFFDIEALFDVDRTAFDPPPDVTSAIVRLSPLPPGTYDLNYPAALSKLVATAFSQRRKTIRNSLRKVADEDLLKFVGIDPQLRPEAIPIAAYVELANALE